MPAASARHQRIQPPGLIQCVKVITSTHMGLADKDLGDSFPATRKTHHLLLAFRIHGHVDLGEGPSFTAEQFLGGVTIGAEILGIYNDRFHGTGMHRCVGRPGCRHESDVTQEVTENRQSREIRHIRFTAGNIHYTGKSQHIHLPGSSLKQCAGASIQCRAGGVDIVHQQHISAAHLHLTCA